MARTIKRIGYGSEFPGTRRLRYDLVRRWMTMLLPRKDNRVDWLTLEKTLRKFVSNIQQTFQNNLGGGGMFDIFFTTKESWKLERETVY